MRTATKRTAGIVAALAAAGLLTAGCGDNSPSVGEMTASAKSGMATGMSKAESMGGSAMNGDESSGGSEQFKSPDGEDVTVRGDTLAKYKDAGGTDGDLGAPIGSPTSGPGGGTCQEFVGGIICDSDATDAQIVWGEIRSAWEGDGGMSSTLGYPTADEKKDGNKYSQTFQHGSIDWSGGAPVFHRN
ncbi:MAG: esterase [Nocardiaceae bacterium]|nr:esterase [Nocardiaceae bacterium]